MGRARLVEPLGVLPNAQIPQSDDRSLTFRVSASFGVKELVRIHSVGEVERAMEFARDSRNVGPEIYLEDLLPDGMTTDGFDIEDDQP